MDIFYNRPAPPIHRRGSEDRSLRMGGALREAGNGSRTRIPTERIGARRHCAMPESPDAGESVAIPGDLEDTHQAIPYP